MGAGERERQAVGQLALACGDREQHRRGGRPAHECRQGVERRGIGPVHVVHPDHQRPARGQPFEQVPQRPMRAVPVARLRRLGPSGRERGQQRREGPGVGEPHPRYAALAELGEMVVERLRPQRVGEVALELRRARPEHQHAVRFCARQQVVEQP